MLPVLNRRLTLARRTYGIYPDLLRKELETLVYVLSMDGKPLMPTERHGKVRRLLKSGKAEVAKRTPFTIRLLYESTTYTQWVSLGVDAGTKEAGLSATTESRVLFEAEARLRTDIQELLSTRRQSRRNRRARKTRYRKPRFDNRKRQEKWLPPSIQNKVDIHVKLVDLVCGILPVSQITVEVAQFDIQKLKNPDIEGEGYQQGEQLGSWNAREYVLFRDRHTCQYCKGRSGDPVLNTHHIRSRKIYGDRPGNLITLCKTCHNKLHSEKLEDYFQPSDKGFRDETQFTVLRWFIYNGLKEKHQNVGLTYGYITKNTRIGNGLQKSHAVDARCVSGNPLAEPLESTYCLKQVRRNNRQLHKFNVPKGGIRKANKAPYLVKGFRLFDRVLFENQACFVFGRRKSGYFDLRLLDGTKIHASANYKKLKLLERANTLLIERREKGDSSPTYAVA